MSESRWANAPTVDLRQFRPVRGQQLPGNRQPPNLAKWSWLVRVRPVRPDMPHEPREGQ
ncbi:hypothetical protein [Phytohabitans houttuyneae]|uniref:hypothetical protein n=1 Tax=Phytohabitans houttuyneae TaxID=1076126 RepID=UPI0015672BA6|nr:hypothetical protein [Phytohabitans houttuyneae]